MIRDHLFTVLGSATFAVLFIQELSTLLASPSLLGYLATVLLLAMVVMLVTDLPGAVRSLRASARHR
jgi:hypothetical protein